MSWGGTGRARIAFLLAALALLLVAWPAAPQTGSPEDPRNASRGERLGVSDCYSCHRVGTWNPPLRETHVVTPLFPRQAKLGEAHTYEIRIENPWLAELRNLSVDVTLSGDAPLLVPFGVDPPQAPEPVERAGNLTHPALAEALDERSEFQFVFRVPPEAGVLRARLEFHPVHPLPEADPATIDVEAILRHKAQKMTGAWSPPEANALTRLYAAEGDGLTVGDWILQLRYRDGHATRIAWSFTATFLPKSEDLRFEIPTRGLTIPKGQSGSVSFQALGAGLGTQELDVHVRAQLYYDHASNEPDWEHYNRYRLVEVPVGDSYIAADAVAAAPVALGRDARVVLGEITGISSALLLPPSLLFGGAFGKDSRRLFNWALGGAKRRVMYHNAVSLGLTLTAIVHVFLFFLEPQYGLTVGVLWGGLGILCLLGLGLTGYYQVPLIQRHGFAWWKVVHSALGALVVVFVAGHTVLDGADFGEMARQLPPWLRSANLGA